VAVGERKDPYLGFNFVVEIDGIVLGGFSEVSGLQVEIEIHTFREGGVNEYMRQIPGPTKYPSNLIFKRGLTDDDALWTWHRKAVRGQVERKNGSVVLRDAAGEERWRWNFQNAFPVKWQGPELKAGTAELTIEVLELVHEGLVNS
jgi:phage tail-like protein